ncbi:MAG: DUF4340 domain-containing protein [Deltaproteobacteria bacterium]|nr:DUF4340 domain-containing protein [Deltaproteobacteria bacterium]
MRYRSTLVYLVAAVVLVGLYLYESHTEKRKKAADLEAKRLFHVTASQIDGLVLQRGSVSLKLERGYGEDEKDWGIVSPVRSGTEKIAVTSFVDTLAELRFSRLVSEKADHLSAFGLDKPELIISFWSGEKQDSISFGSQSPLGEGCYAGKGEGRKIYLVRTADRAALDKNLFDLRNKSLFTLEPDRIERVLIRTESADWKFKKNEGRWILEGSDPLTLDREKVNLIIRDTLLAYALSFEKEKAEALGSFGLDPPATRVALSDGNRTEEILYGRSFKAPGGDRVYAMMTGRPYVVTVRSRMVEDLPKSLDEMREKGGS